MTEFIVSNDVKNISSPRVEKKNEFHELMNQYSRGKIVVLLTLR